MRKRPLLKIAFLPLVLVAAMVPLGTQSWGYHWFNDPGTGPATGTFVFARWPAMPVSYIVDNEPLPAGFTVAGNVTPAFDAWQNVPTSTISFQQTPNTTGVADFSLSNSALNPSVASPSWCINNDGRNEVVWLHADELGALGLGISTRNTDTGDIIDFCLLINVDGAAGTDPTLQGVVTHEVGHVIGVGHSAVGNPDFGFFPLAQAARPTMFPYAQSGDNDRLESLELDDRLIVSRIYPETADAPPDQVPFSLTQQKMSGHVFKGTDGTFTRGVHVRFVNVADSSLQTALFSDFYGTDTGEWDIPGLPPGNWYVVIDPLPVTGTIPPAWIEDDGVGSVGYAGFPAEHFDSAESNHDTATDKLAMPVSVNWNTHNVVLVTNEGNSPDLAITPWGVSQTPPSPPWYQTPDIWVDNDGDGIKNEMNEPERGRNDNQLSAKITNLGNDSASGFKVKFEFRPYTTSSHAPFTLIDTVPGGGALSAGGTRDYTVNWDLTDAFIQANFDPMFWSAVHFCVKVSVVAASGGAFSDANPANNAAQNNYGNVPMAADPGGLSRAEFFMYNHLDRNAMASLTTNIRAKGWRVKFEGIDQPSQIPMKAKEWIAVTAQIVPENGAEKASARSPIIVDISQKLEGELVGGISIGLRAPDDGTGAEDGGFLAECFEALKPYLWYIILALILLILFFGWLSSRRR